MAKMVEGHPGWASFEDGDAYYGGTLYLFLKHVYMVKAGGSDFGQCVVYVFDREHPINVAESCDEVMRLVSEYKAMERATCPER